MKTGFFSRRLPLIFLIFSVAGVCQADARTDIKIPDIPGYVTVRCDFHMHTVFSDGGVWPAIRADEAWQGGLDAFAVSDHVEYQPHRNDVSTNHNRPYEIALLRAEALDLKIIRGSEITRPMPPGHLNAIFLKDANSLDTEQWQDAIKAAAEQGAFIFWNHPGSPQKPVEGKSGWSEGKPIWYPEHTELHKKGRLHGIEVVNGDTYYPEAHKWALEKKLTMMGNSDVHNPIDMHRNLLKVSHRPVTLVFVKEKTEQGIKEALFARRTAVYKGNTLIGEERYLRPIFNESIQILNPDVTLKGKSEAYIRICNKSEIDFELTANGTVEDISIPQAITLYGNKTVLLKIKTDSENLSGRKKIPLPYKIDNLLIAPGEGLCESLVINVNFVPEPAAAQNQAKGA